MPSPKRLDEFTQEDMEWLRKAIEHGKKKQGQPKETWDYVRLLDKKYSSKAFDKMCAYFESLPD